MPSCPRRPALPAALGLLAGIALGAANPAQALLWIAVGAPIFVLLGRRCGCGAASLGLALALVPVGLVLELRDEAGWQTRNASLLPPDAESREMHFVGTLDGPVESDREGERLLQFRGANASKLRLRVRASPPAPTAALDGLDVGDELRVWCRVRRPAGLGNPASVDPSRSLRAAGLDGFGSVKSARLVERIAAGSEGPGRWAGRARRAARERLDEAVGHRGSGRALVGAMLLGDRAGLSDGLFRQLREAGLVHLVAISGLHVGLLLWMAHELLRRARLGSWTRFASMALLLCGFVLLVGPRVPVQRAALAGAALLFGRALGREGDRVNGLAILAAGLAAAAPASIAAPGFQLTFLATAGILLGGRGLASLLPGPRILAGAAGVSGSAYLATAPLVAWHFFFLAPIGLLTNLAAVPLCALILIGGYGTILLSAVPLVGSFFAWVLCRASSALLALADVATTLEAGAFHVPAPDTGLILVYYALLLLLLVSPPRSRAMGWVGGLLGLALIWIHLGPPPPAADGHTEVSVIDVGQGLAVALRGPDGGLLLIDAGGSTSGRFDPGERVVLPFLLGRGAGRIEALIVSHGHADHAAGAFAVLRGLEVGELWLGPGSQRNALLRRLADLAHERGTAVVLAQSGDEGRLAGLPVSVLAPHRRQMALHSNDRSLVVKIGAEPARLLVPGDLERAGELALLDSGALLEAEALVLSHHGSRSASGLDFLERVGPQWAIVSAGRRNPFGHPHREVLERAASLHIPVLRTDELGWIGLRSGPRGWTLSGRARRDGSEPR